MSLAVAVGCAAETRSSSAVRAAAAKLITPAAHINLGDLLLSIAESEPDSTKAKASFAKAVEQYDLVLKVVPNSIEAINNSVVLHLV